MLVKFKKLSKKTLIIIAVASVLAIGGLIAYFATDGFGTNETKNNTTTNNTEAGSSAELIRSALTGNDAVKCTFEHKEDSGTVYISSEDKYRVNYITTEGGGSLIFKDQAMYTWMDGESEGIKIVNPKDSSDEQYDSYSPEKLEENYSEQDMNCERFAFDDSLVELPNDVNFRTFDEMMPSFPYDQ